LGIISQESPIALPENIDINWTLVEKALETYICYVLQATKLKIAATEDRHMEMNQNILTNHRLIEPRFYREAH